MKCSECKNRELLRLDETAVRRHLEGNLVAGIYPLLGNDACFFLAMDFDGDGWAGDISAIRETCTLEKVPAAVERSRSGNGGHVWIFFSEEVPASLARRLGTCLISKTMNKHCSLAINSYDRLFPNQDMMPQGGFGNLIALPLQKEAMRAGNSVFIDETGMPYSDQWAFLASVKKISRGETEALVGELEKTGGKIPARWSPLDEEDEPWARPPSGKKRFNVEAKDLPAEIEAVLSNRVYVKTEKLPSALINQLKHLAAFHNPDFYKKQKQRFSTHATPRIICCAELDSGWLSMPRGCLEYLRTTLSDYGIKLNLDDKRVPGTKLENNFLGTLNTPQQSALNDILAADFGVLSAPPGSGKTIIGIAAMARRTAFAAEWNDNSKIYELWPKLTADEQRNALILKDIEKVLAAGRFPLILTERREHLSVFEALLKNKTDHLAVLYGGMRQKKRSEIFEELKRFPDNCRKAILATGSYIGEGFDEPRLDTLFLTMPASFKGRIVQYAGRLHRKCADKTNVVIYDYVDSGVSVLANMHRKRLKTYKMLGYTVVSEEEQYLPGI